MKKIVTSYVILVTLLSSIFGTPSKVLAQNGSVTITPPFQEVIISGPEAEKGFSIDIRNNTSTTLNISFHVVDFGTLDESGGVAFVGRGETNQPYGLASWLRLDKDNIVVQEKETIKLGGVVENRDSLSPGGHYGAVIGEISQVEDSNQPSVVKLQQAFSSLLFVKKEGGEKYGLEVRNVEVSGNSWLTLPHEVKVRFNNIGNIHVVPRGIVEIMDNSGKMVSKGVINAESAFVLPSSFRSLSVPLSLVESPYLPGWYTIRTSTRYDGREEFSVTEERFFYVGWATVSIILLSLFVILALILITRFKSRQ